MTPFIYNEYNGPETINKEYKLFTLHPKGCSLDIENEKYAENIFKNGEWIFNNSVLENLDFYIKTYLPKYSTAFLNSKSETEKSEMFFGISDDGIIHGIPFKGKLTKQLLKDKVNNILNSDNIKSNEDLNKLIDFEVIKINTDNFNFNENYNYIVEDYFLKKKVFKDLMKKYLMKRKKWHHMMDYYSDKLYYLINNKNTREELIRYIELKAPERKYLIRMLKSDIIFPEKTGDEIAILKNDKNKIWYWLTSWKDNMTDFVKSLKPRPPHGISNTLYPINVITTIVDMIPHWLNKDNEINLYLIKFLFNKKNKKIEISYKGIYGEYNDCYRCLIEGEPCCMPNL